MERIQGLVHHYYNCWWL